VISNDKGLHQDVDEKATFYLKDLAYVSYFDEACALSEIAAELEIIPYMCAINSDYEKVRIVFKLVCKKKIFYLLIFSFFFLLYILRFNIIRKGDG
jgi:hypothetical protein